MSLILNILNFVLGGFVTTLGWLLATVISAVLVVTLPYSRSCWEITKMSFVPFGNDIIHVKYLEPTHPVSNGLGTVLNIFWFIFFGWWLCISHILTGIAQCVTIIGIPTGLAHFKLAGISLFPVGQRVVPKEVAQIARQNAAAQQFEK
ncbi:YccF domain-containing protein [Conservatibacter flavescens]|uniref:Inner membrane protein YccF n=1 Tax=Conservatibacter flavescens TaxID=28161 RepID=A0A2M8S561_9PAST|nr:YccF domain-containing protein [Conservatibacter flavescens]PJG86279.1 YccF domain-containing protein [Conservatibacter flavescens]